MTRVLLFAATLALLAYAEAFAPLSALPLRTGRTGAVSCRSGVRAAACAMDMAGSQSMLLAAAKVAAEAAEDAEEVVEEVAARGAPAISIVGKTVGGGGGEGEGGGAATALRPLR